jgi:hypothetical protein
MQSVGLEPAIRLPIRCAACSTQETQNLSGYITLYPILSSISSLCSKTTLHNGEVLPILSGLLSSSNEMLTVEGIGEYSIAWDGYADVRRGKMTKDMRSTVSVCTRPLWPLDHFRSAAAQIVVKVFRPTHSDPDRLRKARITCNALCLTY